MNRGPDGVGQVGGDDDAMDAMFLDDLGQLELVPEHLVARHPAPTQIRVVIRQPDNQPARELGRAAVKPFAQVNLATPTRAEQQNPLRGVVADPLSDQPTVEPAATCDNDSGRRGWRCARPTQTRRPAKRAESIGPNRENPATQP